MNQLIPQDYGASGSGGGDQTAALQAWINDCQVTGKPGYLPAGQYGISKELWWGGPRPLVISGSGIYEGSVIQATVQNIDVLHCKGTGRFAISDMTINCAAGSTTGGNIVVDGAANACPGARIKNVWMQISVNGILTTGMSAYVIDDVDIAASQNCICIYDGGDSTISHARLTPIKAGSVGIFLYGNLGGTKILSPKINGPNYACGISMVVTESDGDVQLLGGSIEGFVQGGIICDLAGNIPFNNFQFTNLQIGGQGRAIYFPDTGRVPNVLGRMIISANVLQTPLGIAIDGVKGFLIQGNIQTDAGSVIWIGPKCSVGGISGNLVAGPGSIQNNGSGVSVVQNFWA